MRRLRHVRVSVREPSHGTDGTWHTPTLKHPHTRYQQLLSLAPMSGEAILRLQREGFYADWEAVARRRPAIPDGTLLVTFDDNGAAETWLKVVKVLPHGRKVRLMLREVMEEQS